MRQVIYYQPETLNLFFDRRVDPVPVRYCYFYTEKMEKVYG
jgi:hypothetical protein